MSNLVILIPVALFLGAVGLLAFLWALRSGQYEDMDGAAARVLLDDDDPSDGKRPVRKRTVGRRVLPNAPDRRD
jgi:cbb3-type cytochrome oxidase maturation protein